MKFDKLIRDNVLENWNTNYGKNPKTHIADEEEFYEKLKEKLFGKVLTKPGFTMTSEKLFGKVLTKPGFTMTSEKLFEETQEFVKEDNPNELIDILEVLYSIADFKKISRDKLEESRKQKEDKSGAFKKRIILENSEDSKD